MHGEQTGAHMDYHALRTWLESVNAAFPPTENDSERAVTICRAVAEATKDATKDDAEAAQVFLREVVCGSSPLHLTPCRQS